MSAADEHKKAIFAFFAVMQEQMAPATVKQAFAEMGMRVGPINKPAHEASLAVLAVPQWQDIATAPKDGAPILLKFKDSLPAMVAHFSGAQFVGRNRGDESEWSFAAPVGVGGIIDGWLEGWKSLAAPLAVAPTPRVPA